MTKMFDCVDKLAGEIGARPIGTDEEQQAAFFIEDTFKKDTNFDVELQEFDGVVNPELGRLIPAIVVFIACILSFVLPSMPIVPLLLSLVGGGLFIANELGIFSLASFFGKAPSQNVVAKHLPAKQGAGHKKIVVLTNYDTEKTRTEEASSLFMHLGKIKMFEVGAFALAFLGFLIAFFAGTNIIVTIFRFLGIVGALLPVGAFIIHSTGKFSPGANNNAASVAVMLEAAKRISTGVYAPHGEVPIIHGHSVAEAAGVMPDGVPVSWESDYSENPEASAAVASMFYSRNREEKQEAVVEAQRDVQEAPSDLIEPQEPVAEINAPAPTVDISAQSSTPDWFKKGKEKAGSKGNTNAGNVRRSTFGDALDYANGVATASAAPAKDNNDLQKKLQAIHDQIEKASGGATSAVENDAKVAEKVLDNEISQQPRGVTGYLEKQTAAENFEKSKEVETKQEEQQKIESKNVAVSQANAQTKVPELKPLEPEYGVEVDPNEFLDTSKTAPMEKVKKDENTVAKAQARAVEAPKRDIALPSLTGALESKKLNDELAKQKEKEEKEQNAQAQNKLGVQLPSLAKDPSQDKARAKENKAVSNVGAFGVGEATGTFDPITDEDLRRSNSDDDLYVYDADDSALQQSVTDSGAVAGPGYVDIPDTHTESIFGKLFHKKHKDDDTTFSSSIGVDDSYEARKVGKNRGDWSSFQDDAWDDDDWNGGAVVVENSQGAENSSVNERDEIYNFATNDVDTEVWCVALGAECSNHSGLEQFLSTYADDLKGARFITIDALGAGDLAIVENEGVFKPASVQTRMKRFARDAAKSIGISVKSEKMLWKDTTTSKLAAKGHKYVHVAGFEGGRPALLSSVDDVVDAVEEEVLQTSADYLMELIRTL